jgi:hypothetical protein
MTGNFFRKKIKKRWNKSAGIIIKTEMYLCIVEKTWLTYNACFLPGLVYSAGY